MLEYARQLFPLPILAAAPDTLRKCFKPVKCGDFCFEFRDRARCRRLIDNPLFSFARLVVWRVLQLIESFLIQFGDAGTELSRDFCPPIQKLRFAQFALETFPPSPE